MFLRWNWFSFSSSIPKFLVLIVRLVDSYILSNFMFVNSLLKSSGILLVTLRYDPITVTLSLLSYLNTLHMDRRSSKQLINVYPLLTLPLFPSWPLTLLPLSQSTSFLLFPFNLPSTVRTKNSTTTFMFCDAYALRPLIYPTLWRMYSSTINCISHQWSGTKGDHSWGQKTKTDKCQCRGQISMRLFVFMHTELSVPNPKYGSGGGDGTVEK